MPLVARLKRALLRASLALVLLAAFRGVWFLKYRASADKNIRGQDQTELLARRAGLIERVTAPDFGPRSFPEALGDPFRGEWAIVSLSSAGLALAGLAQRFPSEVETTESDLQKLIERARSDELSEFDTRRWKEPAMTSLPSERGHVGYLGHLTLLLAADEVAFPNGPNRALLKKLTDALRSKVTRGPCELAETYPGEIYIPDNAVALAALALAARAGIVGEPGEPTAKQILENIHTRYADKKTGLLPFRLGPACEPGEGRASGASWSLMYLAYVDEPYALKGYEALRTRHLDAPIPGVLGVREWPRGVDRGGDVDSGPLLLGLSPAATGFTLALARRAEDTTTLQGLLDTAELAGFSFEFRGRRSYLTAPVVGDAIVLSARAPLLPVAPAR